MKVTTCSTCEQEIEVTSKGHIRAHNWPGTATHCTGSGAMPWWYQIRDKEEPLKIGDGVRTPSGNTGRVCRVSSATGKVRVRIATGKQAGQLREFNAASLARIGHKHSKG